MKRPIDLYVDNLVFTMKYDGVVCMEEWRAHWYLDINKAKQLRDFLSEAIAYLDKYKTTKVKIK